MNNRIKKKTFDELTITDNYMFQAVMKDPKHVKPLLEMVFEKRINKVVVLEQEKTIETGYDSKGIRDKKGNEVSSEIKEMLSYMDGQVPKSEYSRMLDEAVNRVKQNEERRTEYMSISAFAMDERDMGEYVTYVKLIRGNKGKLSDEDMISFMQITPIVLFCVRKALSEHPDWDDEDIAEEVLAMPEMDQ